MRVLSKVLILLPIIIFTTSSLAATITEIDRCTDMLRHFKTEPDKLRTENELKQLKECLEKMRAAEREPPAIIFRKNTTKQ